MCAINGSVSAEIQSSVDQCDIKKSAYVVRPFQLGSIINDEIWQFHSSCCRKPQVNTESKRQIYLRCRDSACYNSYPLEGEEARLSELPLAAFQPPPKSRVIPSKIFIDQGDSKGQI